VRPQYISNVDLAKKLQLKPGQGLTAVGAPTSLAATLSELKGAGQAAEAALLIFVTNQAALEKHCATVVECAANDRLTWVAYPKAGQLGTDLNRDSLAGILIGHGIQPVRQIALDDVWSALRFRPG
jgi:hypothetical protein